MSKEFSLGAVLSYDPSQVNSPNYRAGLNQFITAVGLRAPSALALAPVDMFEVVGAFGLGNLDLGFAVMYGWTNNDEKNNGVTRSTG